ncbi:response regulator [Maridesulfovibrio sp.]|uniref:ATP-binding response regulator n=1 Tax=Maridesulfovibrio sp. TaxID=2795000 RepID=UPI002AA735DB|nr:response regulator [Maridesulfovibrio sp.]
MSEGFDPDSFLAEFVNECREAAELAVQDILNLEEMHDQDSLDRIFRVLHSIKGNSSMLGLMELSGFVHRVEDACSDIRSGKREVDKTAISVLLKSFDRIDEAFDCILENGHDKIDFSSGYRLLEEMDSQTGVSSSGKRVSEDRGAEPVPAGQSVKGLTAKEVEKAAKTDLPSAADGEEIRLRAEPTALIVDDDFSSRKILSTFLSRYMPCYVAKDGVEAIQAVSESLAGNCPRFDLIMLDIMMPNIDGLQACKAIRQLERSKNLDSFGKESKIFIVSSLGDDETLHKAVYECQADSYIIKPVTFDRLQKQLERFKLIAS